MTLLFGLTGALQSQITIDRSPLAGNLPTAIEPGAPLGSFSLSNLDSIDPYRGSLSVAIPLIRVSGRGEAGYLIQARVSSSSWYVNKQLLPNVDGSGAIASYTHTYQFSQDWGSDAVPLYSPGRVFIKRQVGNLTNTCGPGGPLEYQTTYAHVIFADADGTQHNLIDGDSVNNVSCSSGYSLERGSNFYSIDGSGLKFVSDSVIYDMNHSSFYDGGSDRQGAQGYLYFPNGTVFRVELGRVRWIRDRNGNKTTFTYRFVNIPGVGLTETDQPETITDSIGRTVSIEYDVDFSTYREDRLTYKGYNNSTRTIYVRKRPYKNSLLSGSPTTELFPNSGFGSPTPNTASLADVPYQVVLPNSQFYEVKYNPYGEIERLSLPTGGRVDYSHGAGLASPYFSNAGGIASMSSGQVNVPSVGTFTSTEVGQYCFVYRRLLWRREYIDSGSTIIGVRSYSQPTRRNSSTGAYESVSTDPNRTHLVSVNEGLSGQKSDFYYQTKETYPASSNSAVLYLAVEFTTVTPPVPSQEGRILEQKDYDTNGTSLLQTTNNTWLTATRGVFLSTADVTLGSKKKRQSFIYDSFGNTLTNTFYDWVASGSTPNVVLKTITNTYETNTSYTNPPRHLTGLLKSRQIAGGGITSTVSFYYDETSPALVDRGTVIGHDYTSHGGTMYVRGNATRSEQIATFPGRANRTTTIKNEFDTLGNVVKFVSPRSANTTFTYSDVSGTSGCVPPSTSYAFVTGISNPVSHSWSYKYDFCTGQIVEETDPNTSKTALEYADNLDRITKVTRAVGHGTAEACTRFVYDDTGRNITTYRAKDAPCDDAIWSAISYDGLGRTTQTRKSDGQGTIYVDLQYDEFHRVKQQTSPYRSGDTAYWNYTTYDGLGRTKTQVAPGSATTSYTYTDNVTRITDPASVWRESTVDGAGRLIKVKEKTNDETTYTYNGLDNLLTVTQGAQTRTFSYDSAGLLAQVTNPESGTFTHFYDASGNVSQTNLPQGGSVTYTYDLIERRTFSDYSDANTPDVTLTWDTSSKMRLYRSRAHTGATTVAQTTFGSYDPLGRALTSSQDIIGAASAFNFTYTYDRAGNLRTMGYPSGRSLTITYTTGSLISALSGTKSSVTTNYLTSPSYTPFGALSQVTLANGLIERTDYLNGLPQVRQIRLGDSGNATLRGDWQFRYCNYGASPFFRADSCAGNNGNVLGQIHTISGASFNQTYNYDDVNRLCTVRETSSTTPLAPRACGDATGLSGDTWYQSYMFDRWGNMAVKATPGVTPHPLTVSLLSSYNTANNRLTGSNWAYDAAGNMTTHGGWTLAYDAANRMKTSQPIGGSVTSYVYDADGRRVKKTTGSTSTYFVYDAFGQLAAEYASTDPTGTTETHYLTTDHLGSTRLVTNQTGAVVSRHDYLPFGWELYSGLTGRTNGHGYLTSPEGVHTPTQRFTGKERDAETGLDYFLARYYSGAQGRFTSPDPVHILKQKLLDPQQWNMYAYVRNNPLRFRDPTGKYICSGTEKECAAFEQTRQQALNSKNADIRRAGLAYGDPGKRNGVTVGFADKITSGKVDRGGTVQRTGTGIEANPADPSKVQATLLVTIQKGQIGNLGTIAHEGSHVADYQEFINSVNTGGIFDQRLNITHRATETRAYQLSIGISLSGNDPLNYGPCGVQRECKFTPGMMPALRDQLIQDLLNDPRQGYKDLDSVLYPEPFFRNQ
jgi:RHS repeat-associated protein